jgi:hypothetical protein
MEDNSTPTPEKPKYAKLKAGHGLDSYDPDLVSQMSQRCGLDASDLLDPKFAKLLKGKIDADMYVTELRAQLTAATLKYAALADAIKRRRAAKKSPLTFTTTEEK